MRDVCMAYEVYALRIYGVCTTFILIYGVSVLYQIILIPMRTNGCVHFVHAIRILQFSIIRGRICHQRNVDNLY